MKYVLSYYIIISVYCYANHLCKMVIFNVLKSSEPKQIKVKL